MTFNRKILYVAVAVILLAELIWAYQALGGSLPFLESSKPKVNQVSQIKTAPPASLVLKTSQTNLKVLSLMTVDIEESSAKATDGTDLILLYDPQALSVVVDSKTKAPVIPGPLYKEYPVNKVDETAGRITISGISPLGQGIVPNGIFGSVVFQAKKAGKTKISIEFTPGSTTDSNVIETKTAKDLLDEVRNLELNITP